jgi:alkylation response protein AidB-like acyl-CoA dehydrogenase
MALAITDDHRALADVVRSFADDHKLRASTRAALSGQPEDPGATWKSICDLGWTGLHLPESADGAGYGLPELAVVLEQFGYAVAPGPFLPSVMAAATLVAAGQQELGARLLPGLADGTSIGAVALGGAVRAGATGLLEGSTGLVPGGRWADLVLVQAGDDLAAVQVSDPAVRVEPVSGLDPAIGAARVHLAGADAVILAGAARLATRVARVLAAAEATGGCWATLGMALDYAKVREQFGRTIGSFQAVKHHLANMLVDAERATAATWDAARAAAADDGQADLSAAVAAAVTLDAYRRNAQQAIQVFGGIGFTWEHDAHLYLRRALTLAAVWGPVEQAEQEVADLARQGIRRQYTVDLPPEAQDHRREAAAFAGLFRQAPQADRRGLLVESGYLVPHWPRPWGRAAGPVEQLVIDEELRGLGIPSLGIGGWVLLTLTQHGTSEQVQRWIPAGLAGEQIWCQLFSEPGAGSDAAAVQTRAVRVDGGWRVTGQKVWTSGAHLCHRGLATVRTDPSAPKHKGITMMVIDLHTDGVEVRPLREITGDALFNEVFFTDVFVPDADVVGAVNEGWTVARATLGNERLSIGGDPRDGGSAAGLLPLLTRGGEPDAAQLREFGRLVASEQAIRLINLRRVARAVAQAEPGAEGNVTKLLAAEHLQHVTELAMRLAGPAGVDGSEPDLTRQYLFARAMTIAGGTSEISRNVIAERLLGLPRDPLVR